MFALNKGTIKDLISDLENGRYESAARYEAFSDIYSEWKVVVNPDFRGMVTIDVTERVGGRRWHETVVVGTRQVYREIPAWGFYMSPTGSQYGLKYNQDFGQELILDMECPSCDINALSNIIASLKRTEKAWEVAPSQEIEARLTELRSKYPNLTVKFSIRFYVSKDGFTLLIPTMTSTLPTEEELLSKYANLQAEKEKERSVQLLKEEKARSQKEAETAEKAEIEELRQLLKASKERKKTGLVGKPAEVKRLRELCQKYPKIY